MCNMGDHKDIWQPNLTDQYTDVLNLIMKPDILNFFHISSGNSKYDHASNTKTRLTSLSANKATRYCQGKWFIDFKIGSATVQEINTKMVFNMNQVPRCESEHQCIDSCSYEPNHTIDYHLYKHISRRNMNSNGKSIKYQLFVAIWKLVRTSANKCHVSPDKQSVQRTWSTTIQTKNDGKFTRRYQRICSVPLIPSHKKWAPRTKTLQLIGLLTT